MLAYEFYWRDREQKEHLLGILPERRKKLVRITEESILKWAWKLLGNKPGAHHIYFVRVEMLGT